MTAFTPERRVADNPALIPPTGDRRRKSRIACDPAREEAFWRENSRRERAGSQLGWEKNRHAARAAWERFDDPSLWIDASQ